MVKVTKPSPALLAILTTAAACRELYLKAVNVIKNKCKPHCLFIVLCREKTCHKMPTH